MEPIGGKSMSRCVLIILSAVISLASVGCCGVQQCNDCDGVGYGEPVLPQRPFDRIRNLRKGLVCGSGCGEVYVGEWTSTPPDCNDPCCGTDFVGGATPCRPKCWQPGNLFRQMLGGGLYGGRYCDGDASSAACGCGETGCNDCGSGHEVIGSEIIHSASPNLSSGSNCGCASHVSPVGVSRTARRSMPKRDSITKQR